MKLTNLRYKGGSYASLQNFLFELESRFLTFSGDLESDGDRIVYAGSSLEGHLKTRWTNYVRIQHHGDLSSVTWEEMKNWLGDSVSDADTRSLEAVGRLRRLNQKEDQTFTQFLDVYEEVESELAYEVPEKYRVCSMIDALRPDLRRQIVSMGIPGSRQELITSARRAESLLKNSYSQGSQGGYRNKDAGRPQPAAQVESVASSTTLRPQEQELVAPPVRPQVDRAEAQQRGTCYRCGQPGHYANACPNAKCNRCGKAGHYARYCTDDPVSGANATPQVRRAVDGQ